MLELYKKRMSLQGRTVGQALKKQSDMIMEQTWGNDTTSAIGYIYDYYHDDQPMLNQGMTYADTTKTKIDIKFFKVAKTSLSKDQVEYRIMFKPSQNTTFVEDDDLYYYKRDYTNKYGSEFPIGCYIDIPDDKGIYKKWLICAKEISNQFVNYLVLPCNYFLHWIEDNGTQRIKRKMWCVLRSQSSYNSGLWESDIMTTPENQNIVWLPMNLLSEKLFYTYPNGKNQRLIISSPTQNPLAWKISKVENAKLIGLQKITLAQDLWNASTDYIDIVEQSNGDLFAMYADYYSSTVMPVEDVPVIITNNYSKITCTNNKIKVKGSYKTLTVSVFDEHDNDITNTYIDENTTITWSYSINDLNVTEMEVNPIEEKTTDCEVNQIKIKFGNERQHLTKILLVNCVITKEETSISSEIQLEIGS